VILWTLLPLKSLASVLNCTYRKIRGISDQKIGGVHCNSCIFNVWLLLWRAGICEAKCQRCPVRTLCTSVKRKWSNWTCHLSYRSYGYAVSCDSLYLLLLFRRIFLRYTSLKYFQTYMEMYTFSISYDPTDLYRTFLIQTIELIVLWNMFRHNLFLHSALVLSRNITRSVSGINVSTIQSTVLKPGIRIKSNKYEMISNDVFVTVSAHIFPHRNWNCSIGRIHDQCRYHICERGGMLVPESICTGFELLSRLGSD